MIINGFIVVIVPSGNGLSEDGNPIPIEDTLAPEVSCNIKTLNKELKDSMSGRFTDESYQVLVVGKMDETCKEIILKDNDGVELGRFEIKEREYLSFVQRTKLVV